MVTPSSYIYLEKEIKLFCVLFHVCALNLFVLIDILIFFPLFALGVLTAVPGGVSPPCHVAAMATPNKHLTRLN